MIERHDRDGVTILRLSHGKANTLDLASLRALTAELEALGSTRVLILTGGGSMFSAGIDLPNLLERDSGYTLDLVEALDELLDRFIDLTVPSVAAINGHAIAGGYILACGCDLRLMAEGEGRVGLTEHRVGVPFPPRALELTRQAVGERLTRRLILRAELFDAAVAFELGLVDELVPVETLMERALEVARQLGATPRRAFELSKRQLTAPLRMRLDYLGEAHGRQTAQTWVSDETREVMRGFVRQRLG